MNYYAKRFFAQINEIPRDGLIREYLLGGNTLDTSGNGQHGTTFNVSYISDYAVFNGTSSYINIPNQNFEDSYTFSFVIDFSNVNSTQYFIGNSAAFGIRYNGLNFIASYGTASIVTVAWTKINGFINLIVERVGVNFNIYINGVFIGASTRGSVTNSGNDRIGKTADDFFFNGKMKKIRIYNRVLTQSEKNKLSNEL